MHVGGGSARNLNVRMEKVDEGTKLECVSCSHVEGELLILPLRLISVGSKITVWRTIKVIFLRILDLEARATNRAHIERDLIKI